MHNLGLQQFKSLYSNLRVQSSYYINTLNALHTLFDPNISLTDFIDPAYYNKFHYSEELYDRLNNPNQKIDSYKLIVAKNYLLETIFNEEIEINQTIKDLNRKLIGILNSNVLPRNNDNSQQPKRQIKFEQDSPKFEEKIKPLQKQSAHRYIRTPSPQSKKIYFYQKRLASPQEKRPEQKKQRKTPSPYFNKLLKQPLPLPKQFSPPEPAELVYRVKIIHDKELHQNDSQTNFHCFVNYDQEKIARLKTDISDISQINKSDINAQKSSAEKKSKNQKNNKNIFGKPNYSLTKKNKANAVQYFPGSKSNQWNNIFTSDYQKNVQKNKYHKKITHSQIQHNDNLASIFDTNNQAKYSSHTFISEKLQVKQKIERKNHQIQTILQTDTEEKKNQKKKKEMSDELKKMKKKVKFPQDDQGFKKRNDKIIPEKTFVNQNPSILAKPNNNLDQKPQFISIEQINIENHSDPPIIVTQDVDQNPECSQTESSSDSDVSGKEGEKQITSKIIHLILLR